MFSAAENPLLAHPLIERAGQADYLLDGLSVTAPAKRIVRVVVEGDVQDWTEIEVEPEKQEKPSGDLAVTPDEGNVTAIAQLLCVWRFVADQTQPGNAPAFLVDRDDRLDIAEIAQVVDQLPKLRRALDVSPKKDETPRLDPPKQVGCLPIQFVAGNTSED